MTPSTSTLRRAVTIQTVDVSSLLPVIAAILVSGLVVQLVAHHLKVPSVIFYLLIGVVLGPEVLGLVTLDTFGNGLEIIVGISVAIIVFEGRSPADRADPGCINGITPASDDQRSRNVPRNGSRGPVFEGANWEISLLIGALLVATGPTVITPILNVVRVRDHVATALETEGIVNDVTAAIVAVVIFETLLLDDLGVPATLFSFVERLGVGVLAGVLATVVIYFLLDSDLVPERDVQASQFLVLAAAVGAFAAAEAVAAAEAGIAAAATSGILLGNLDIDNREEIEQFAENTTLVVLSFVFISLAALINVEAIAALGLGAVGIVLVIMLVLRPLGALIATAGVERFTWPERLFIAGVGPRGIIPASVATLFAIELELAGNVAAGELLVGTVFAVIFATVAIEAGLAKQIGDVLGVSPMRTIIIGGGRVGRALATRLERRGEYVVIVEIDDEEIERARSEGFTVHEGDGSDTETLRGAGIGDAKRVITVTGDDDINLLACQLSITKFDIEAVYSRVNEPDNVDAFDSIGVKAIDSPTATAVAIDDEIERPAITHWMSELGDSHDVQEVEVTAENLAGKTIRDLNAQIPDGAFVAVVSATARITCRRRTACWSTATTSPLSAIRMRLSAR